MKSLSWHLNKNGLSDTLMKDLLQKANVSSLFHGVFPLNEIPVILTSTPSFVIIVNIGYHFVTIYGTSSYIYYIDTFGKRPPPDLYHSFLNACQRSVFFNPIQIQSVKSTHCGFFSCLFTIFFCRKPKHRLKFHKKRSDLLKNDKKCIEYLKQLSGNK